ncbi:RRXRR domain-containing protein [Okeania sp. KiyG1]|nr:RRXRR domain-containing protein [Okeania sp. KiyG1]
MTFSRLDKNKKPLQPCKPTVARRLLNSGRAAVYR